MRKLLRPAVLFCILLILFSGCTKTETADQTLDHIRISNLKTSSSALSQEEQAYMDEICSILEAAEYVCEKNHSETIHAYNNSQHDLNLHISISGFNKDGCLKYTRYITLNRWEKGQKLAYSLLTSSPPDVETVHLIGQYEFNGVMYMTDPIPLPIVSNQGETEITINYSGYLPTVFRLEQSQKKTSSYTLMDFKVERRSDTYQTLILFIRKESGEDNQSDSIPIRMLDKDGHVHYSGSSTVYLSRGETARVVFSVPIYEPGEYYLELK